ncbi:MAG TPA: hypothetical protein VIN09_13785 [Chloroflexota bacterium]
MEPVAYCPWCGCKREGEAASCASCGKPLALDTQARRESPPPVEKTDDSSGTGWLARLAVITLVCVLLLWAAKQFDLLSGAAYSAPSPAPDVASWSGTVVVPAGSSYTYNLGYLCEGDVLDVQWKGIAGGTADVSLHIVSDRNEVDETEPLVAGSVQHRVRESGNYRVRFDNSWSTDAAKTVEYTMQLTRPQVCIRAVG